MLVSHPIIFYCYIPKIYQDKYSIRFYPFGVTMYWNTQGMHSCCLSPIIVPGNGILHPKKPTKRHISSNDLKMSLKKTLQSVKNESSRYKGIRKPSISKVIEASRTGDILKQDSMNFEPSSTKLTKLVASTSLGMIIPYPLRQGARFVQYPQEILTKRKQIKFTLTEGNENSKKGKQNGDMKSTASTIQIHRQKTVISLIDANDSDSQREIEDQSIVVERYMNHSLGNNISRLFID